MYAVLKQLGLEGVKYLSENTLNYFQPSHVNKLFQM